MNMNNLPFDKPGRFYRGNLHCHSNFSDGSLSPEAVCHAYATNRYDFISLTDHHHPMYDEQITNTIPYRTANFTTLIGAELHHGLTTNGVMWHIVVNGLPLDFEPPAEHETAPQLVQRALAAGAFVAIPHPQWHTLTVEDALDLGDGVHAIEVYNATCGDTDTAYGDYFLDLMLARGKWYNAIATDDAHFGNQYPDSMRGWTMVKAEANEPEALLEGLKKGWFYASQGPEIHDIEIVPNEKIIVTSSPVNTVFLRNTFPVDYFGAPAIGPSSARAYGNGMLRSELSLENVAGSWARIVVVDHLGRRAWSNPFKF